MPTNKSTLFPFLLHVSWSEGVRAIVVPREFEISSAPGPVWAPSNLLTAPLSVSIRGTDHPTMHVNGRSVGGRHAVNNRLAIAVAPLPLDAHREPPFASIIGSSLPMRRMCRQIDDARGSDLPLLIRGETGTGKELIARTVHDGSVRSGQPYVVIDCAAITESLLESELFGHVKGAFSGAISTRVGAFEAANGGTVFIDEVGELPSSMQPKLLRVLESGTFRRVGENHHRVANVRVIAATHRDLRQMVALGTFREDLYYRLAVLEATAPPLRERHGDLPGLVRSFVPPRVFSALSNAQWEAMETHPWRGNVRELRNFAQRAVLRGWDGLFDAATGAEPSSSSGRAPQPLHSPPRLPTDGEGPVAPLDQPPLSARYASGASPAVHEYRNGENLADFRTRWALMGEAGYLAAVLRAEQGSVVRAAARAQVDRTHFHRLLRRHGLARAAARDSFVDTGQLPSLADLSSAGDTSSD